MLNFYLQATKVCKEVKEEEMQLTAQEEEVRAERSMLIKRLASTIAGRSDSLSLSFFFLLLGRDEKH